MEQVGWQIRKYAPGRGDAEDAAEQQVVEAEAEVPRAMAEAFRNGNLGIMDYTRYQNVTADTEMRKAIAGGDDGSRSGGES